MAGGPARIMVRSSSNVDAGYGGFPVRRPSSSAPQLYTSVGKGA